MSVLLDSHRRVITLIGSHRDTQECRSHPTLTPKTYLSIPTASASGLTVSVRPSASVASVGFPRSYSFETAEAHFPPQVSTPTAVPALCTLRTLPGLAISPNKELPIHLVATLAVALVLAISSLLALVFLVFCRFVCLWPLISAVEKPNHHTDIPTRKGP